MELDYQKLNYFNNINEGQIFTHLNPTFTFGLNKLKTSLLKECEDDSDEIAVLLIKNDNLDRINIYIENENMTITK